MVVKSEPITRNASLDGSDEEKDWFQILAICLVSISSVTAGMLFGWSSPSIPRIVEDKINYNITLEEASYFTVLPPVGAIISSFFYSKLIDIIGRKYTLLSMAIPHILSLVIIANTTSVYVFYLARLITGFGDACLFASIPVYVGEVATPKIRGSWGNLMTFGIYFGQLSINVIGSYTSVPVTAYITMSLPVVFLFTFVFMPESPYFYLMKGRTEDARQVLRRLRRKQNVEEELETLRLGVERQMSERGTWKDLVTIDSNRRAVFAGIFLRASQQLAGTASFVVYTQYIFLKSGGDVSASTSAIIYCGLCTVLNLCAGYTLDKIGRRKSYFLSSLLCGVVLLCESIYFFIDQYFAEESDLSAVNWIPLVGMILFVLFYSFGLGIVPTLMLGELFSANVKGKGLMLMNIIFGLLVSSVTKLFQLLDSNIGLYSPFLFFSLSCFVSTFLSLYFVPETKGKTLEEIQQSLKKTKKDKLDQVNL